MFDSVVSFTLLDKHNIKIAVVKQPLALYINVFACQVFDNLQSDL